MFSSSCSQRGSSSGPSSDAACHDAVQADGQDDGVVADVDLVSDLEDDGEDTEVMPVACPVGSGELDKSQADEISGKPCDATVSCGGFDYCMCSAWCDCTQGYWVCDSVCDDSCLEDVKDAL